EVAGRWWMFVNVTAYGAGNRDELHLYHAETPLGPWTPHARNPVKSDCRGARPAGRLFRRDGQLFRPAQNCAGGYGSSIVVHRIDLLTTQAYVETQVAEIRPDWDPKARRAHTINRCDGFLVLDLLRRRSRF
ncbi:MAG: formyl transferase, partial [Planctomycetes bacterium]|nr:formyl transferase [Planctomycetota bacterium]